MRGDCESTLQSEHEASHCEGYSTYVVAHGRRVHKHIECAPGLVGCHDGGGDTNWKTRVHTVDRREEMEAGLFRRQRQICRCDLSNKVSTRAPPPGSFEFRCHPSTHLSYFTGHPSCRLIDTDFPVAKFSVSTTGLPPLVRGGAGRESGVKGGTEAVELTTLRIGGNLRALGATLIYAWHRYLHAYVASHAFEDGLRAETRCSC